MGERSGSHAPVAFWRDVRVIRIIVQVVFLLAIALVVYWLFTNYTENTKRFRFGFDFLTTTAGFTLSEGIPHQRTDSNAYLLWVGIANTLRVIFVGIVLASLLGLIAGVARLSRNWLVSKIATVYVETIRNTPLLVQLFFWYTATFLKLPGVQDSFILPGPIYLSQRGLVLPRPYLTAGASAWEVFLLAGLVVGLAVYIARRLYLQRVQRPGFPSLWGFGVFALFAIVGWALAPERPIAWEIAELRRFNFKGGIQLSPEFAALLTGLVIYTGAFIAEIVRGGILAVSKGQREAAMALGLKGFQILRLVILPQALRVIVPPVTSQYLNLAKNSSLAVAVGYPDLFSVASTIINKTGREVEMILVIMASYLTLSLLTSAFMNWYNRRIRLVER
jgi:general L-amino acid transport system permease protein